MKLFFHHTESNNRLELDTKYEHTVKDVKEIVEKYFKLDTKLGYTGQKLIFNYAGSDLKDEWIIQDLTIPIGATIKCKIIDEKLPDFLVCLKFQKRIFKMYDTGLDPIESKVFHLRIKLSNALGLPLSIFRLKSSNNLDMFDDSRLVDYGVTLGSQLILETWSSWDNFLNYCIKGFTHQALRSMSQDEYIKQYQMKIALFIAAHYGNLELASTLMSMGAKSDQPVGEHPCRQWCSTIIMNRIDKNDSYDRLKLEYLKCPIHVAVLNGQLKIVMLIAKNNIHILEKKDGFGLPPWRLSLHNKHKDPVKNNNQKDVARYLLSKQFGGKVNLNENCRISISLYAKIKNWIEKAKEKVLENYGLSKSSIKKKLFYKSGLVGNKVLIDGYNNNFRDYQNSYERLRAKYKYYYFIDEEDKDKKGYPDLYFKTVGLIKPSKFKASSFNQQAETQAKSQSNVNKIQHQLEANNKSNLKTLKLWKKAVNLIIFRETTKKYAPILRSLGIEVDIDDEEDESQDYNENFDHKKSNSKTNNKASMDHHSKQKAQLINKSNHQSTDKKVKNPSTIKIHKTNSILTKHQEISMSDKLDKSSKSVKLNLNRSISFNNCLSKSDNKEQLPRINNLTSKDQKLNSSLKSFDSFGLSMSIPKMSSDENFSSKNAEMNSKEIYNFSLNYFESKYMEVKKKTDDKPNKSKNRSLKDFENETMTLYLKYSDGLTPLETAQKLLDNAKEFKTKTWLQQINMASQMAVKNAKRRLDGSLRTSLVDPV